MLNSSDGSIYYSFLGGKSDIETNNIFGRPEISLEQMGYIKLVQDSTNTKFPLIFLTPKAFQWENYDKKSKIAKWIYNHPVTIRDIFIAFSFIASLVLTIFQILDKFP